MSVKTLTLIRGIPGTGKTTLSGLITGRVNRYEADNFFMINGKYTFSHILLPEAHKLCLGDTASSLYHGTDAIVSNTMCSVSEVQEYVNLAEKLLANVVIIECTKQYIPNPHSLGEEDMKRFRRRWVPNSELRSKIKAENIKIFYITN